MNVQQVDKHLDLFKISHAGGFSDPDCVLEMLSLKFTKSSNSSSFVSFRMESLFGRTFDVFFVFLT